MWVPYTEKVARAKDFFKNQGECPYDSSMSSWEWKQMCGKGWGENLTQNRLAKAINGMIIVSCPLFMCWNLKMTCFRLQPLLQVCRGRVGGGRRHESSSKTRESDLPTNTALLTSTSPFHLLNPDQRPIFCVLNLPNTGVLRKIGQPWSRVFSSR